MPGQRLLQRQALAVDRRLQQPRAAFGGVAFANRDHDPDS
jgi:hypothetical protein